MVTKQDVIKALKKCKDPELDIDVWTLGIIYDISIEKNNVSIKMTFTTPFCPYGSFLVEAVKEEVKKIRGINQVDIEIVFDPPWKPSDELRAMLGV